MASNVTHRGGNNWYEDSVERTRVNYTYCGGRVYTKFWTEYMTAERLGIITLILCLMVVLTNTLNVVIFSRKNMRNSTNLILLTISLTDLLMAGVTGLYCAAAIMGILGGGPGSEYFAGVLSFIIFASNIIGVITSVSLNILMAIWRYVAVLHPLKAKSFCTMGRTRLTLMAILGFNLIITAIYLSGWRIVAIQDYTGGWGDTQESACGLHYCLDIAEDDWYKIYQFMYACYGFILLKGLGSLLLAYITIRLIVELRVRRAARRNMKRAATSGDSTTSSLSTVTTTTTTSFSDHEEDEDTKKNEKELASVTTRERACKKKDKDKEDDTNRITKMLVMILIIFLIEQLVPATLNVLGRILGDDFQTDCKLLNKLVIQTLYGITNSLNFLVYLTMNRQFRGHLVNAIQTFSRTMSCRRKW